ncbi:hypothetical protein BH09BAC1_BH09BAC1_23410 [soil metagenome]
MHRHLPLVLLSLVLLLFSVNAHAQLENTFWFFGNSTSGVFFDPAAGFAPTANNVQFTPFGGEGCGVVTDPVTGQLLFYSDGERVLNRNNVPMPNGTTLGGCASSAQAVAMAPVPGFCDRYYIFSNTSGSGCPTTELRWSIVNMSLNGGLGDVEIATKNTLIRSDAYEGMIIMQRPGFKEYWLIGKMTNNTTFFVYNISAGGIVLANQFVGYAAFNYNLNYSAVAGKMAVCHPSGPVYTYDFNSNTGTLSNPVNVGSVANNYDAEFSPDGTKLYYSSWASTTLKQYDFTNGVTTTLYSSGSYGGGLRTGPDGKIYHISNNGGTALGVIDLPNAAGAACNYNPTAFNLGVTIGGLNLPEVLAGTIPDVISGITTGTINNVSCFGGADGKAWAAATNGQAPYTYEWSNSTLGDTLRNVAPGTYYITITDNIRCKIRDTVVITEPTQLAISPIMGNVNCNGQSTGTTDLGPTGGTTPYTALWNDANTSVIRSGMAAGSYTATVTDANGCTANAPVSITQPSALTLTQTHTNASCNGAANGTANLTVGGGQPNYSYLWSDAGNTASRTGLAAGIYTVTVYDALQCSITASVTITEPAVLTLTNVATNVSCFGGNNGAITTNTTGGTAPYTYLWNTGELTANRTNIVAGSYTVTVTDRNNCTATTSATITQPTASLTLTRVVTNASCNGATDGAIDLNVAGGTAPYSYAWSNGATTEDIANLNAGIYRPTVTDANGCTATATITVTEPAVIQIAMQVFNTTCSYSSNGNISTNIAGGSGPYTWVWNDGNQPLSRNNLAPATYTITVTDANNCTATQSATVTAPPTIVLATTTTDVLCFGNSTGAVTLTVTNAAGGAAAADYLWSDGGQTQNNTDLPAGTYTVTVTDQSQCTATTTATVNQPLAPLSLNSTQMEVLCFGQATGAIDLQPQGGTAPYGFIWSNAATTEDISNLIAGTYTVTVTDNNNCTATLTAFITQPADALSLTSTHVDAACFGSSDGTIDLTPTGSVAPYTYVWSNASTQEDPINLAAGSYIVTTTDANGCTATHTATVGQPALLEASLANTAIACHRDATAKITSTVTGGTGPYTYLWSTGEVTADLSNVAAGTYDVTVTDAHQCVSTATITVTEPPAIAFTQAVTDVSCFSFNDGYLTLNTSGGTGTINMSWAGGEYPDNNFTGLAPGNYTLVLTDANGCDTSFTIDVAQPDSIFVNILPTDTLRIGQADTIQLTEQVNPGTTTYFWEPSKGLSCYDCPNPIVEVYYNTEYTLTIDNNGCFATDTLFVIVDPDKILYLPSGFSPNGDNKNDVLYVYADGVRKIIWSVYDRWGEEVFRSTDIMNGWDGKKNGTILPPGVFILDVYIEFLDLTSQRKTQSVTLLR